MTTSTDENTGQTKITDSIVIGDTYVGLKLIVKDEDTPSKVFSNVVVTVELAEDTQFRTGKESEIIYEDTLTPDYSVSGQVSAILQIPPSITETFPVGKLIGIIKFEFQDEIIEGESFVKTNFILELNCIKNLWPNV